MSNKTKSFFNDDNRKKHSSWYNNRHSRQAPTSTTLDNAPQHKPPIPASSETRTKLKEFQFVGAAPERASMITSGSVSVKRASAMADISRAGTTTGGNDSTAFKTSSSNGKENHQPDRKIGLPHANTFPSTPSDRLTLDELIGNIDESKLRKPAEESPDEILGWNPNSSNPVATPGRKRKRAQSSSPVCQGALSQQKVDAGSEVRAVHKTPVVDLAAELWQRYDGAGNQSGNGLKLSDISFALQATPKSIETPVKSAGLRRWASAGNEWPTSRSKRQRTNPSRVWHDEHRSANGQSKVAALVDKIDKIQESLASQRLDKLQRDKDDPSSSSPLPGAVATFSPCQAFSKAQSYTVQSQEASQLITGSRKNEKTNAGEQASQHLRSHHSSGQPALSQAQPDRRNSVAPQAAKKLSKSDGVQLIAIEDLDELAMDVSFDDFDDMNNDTIIQRIVGPASQDAAVLLDAKDLAAFEDDFEDDIADDEFGLADMDEQGFLDAEVSATQAHTQRASSRTK